MAVAIATLLAAVGFSNVAGEPFSDGNESTDETVIIQLRVWQRIHDAEELWISARESGGRWDMFGTVRLNESNQSSSAGYFGLEGLFEPFFYTSYKVQLAGIGLRIWQRHSDPESIFIEACVSPCQPPTRTKYQQGWKPLGKIPLPLTDGLSSRGFYRYGNLTLAIPRDNQGLQSDRQHLLALRDVLEGGATELDWDVGKRASAWEGVTVEGSPPRVVALDLVDRGLAGELWGYIGDLSQLQALRLDGNSLHGRLPSKLSALPQLAVLTLAGNDFSGCIPWGLRPNVLHDFQTLGLSACSAPVWLGRGDGTYLIPDGVDWRFPIDGFYYWLVYDEPLGSVIQVDGGPGMLINPAEIKSIYDAVQNGWEIRGVPHYGFVLYLAPTNPKYEIMRSHYTGCVYDCNDEPSNSALLEQIAASFWRIPPDWIETAGPASWDERQTTDE